MEVRKGFKQTEVGIIPEDWDLSPINAVASVKTGPFGSTLHEKDYVQDGTPIITVEHLSEQGVIHSNLPMVSDVDLHRLSAYSLQTGDIVFSRVGSVDRNSLISEKEDGWLFSGRLLRIRAQSKNLHTPFLSYYFHSNPFKQRIRSVAVGQTMASLNTQIVNAIQIVVPPLPEQHAIATALSDVDALLTAQEALITKKRLVKQGTMQELLTGKKRLPGYREDWVKCHLSDIGTFSKGRGIKKDEVVPDGIPCIRYGEIYTHYNDYIRNFNSFITREVANQSQRIKKGDLLLTGSGETADGIGKCVAFLGDQEAYAGGDVVIFTPTNQNSLYLGYYLNHASIIAQKSRMAQGDAIVHISAQRLGQLNLHLPLIGEQTAIAEILSDMDAEIAALEAQREKTHLLKQGMMQELLTGKIRLI